MAGSQTLVFDVVGNASSAVRAFRETADTASLAARGATAASDAMKLQAKSAEVSAGATLALARADKILADAELGLARDITVANAVLGKQNTALLGNATAGAVGSMLSAAASGKAPSSGGGSGLAPGIAMAAAAMGIASRNSRLFSDSISQGTPVWDSARKGIFGLNGELQLFGGALTKVGIPAFLSAASTVHLVTEAVIETAGTLAPAAIAFGVFAAAAVPAVQDIYTQMTNLHTVTTALGADMPGLSGNFSKMADAVRPQVYQLFGEALVFANSGTGQLQTLATGAGKVLDDLGARFVFATTQGKGFSAFIDKATSDLAGWGNLIGNIGGIFGGLLKVLPGYAEQILAVLQGVSHGIEVVVNSGLGQWILGIGLAAHGALFYIGLMGTGFAVLASRTLPLIASAALGAAAKVEGLGAAGKAASSGLLAFGGAAEGAAALPWGWISIAAAGLAFLAYQLVTAKSAAQQFGSALESTITSAPLDKLAATMAGSVQAAAQALAQQQKNVAGTQAALQRSAYATGRDIGNLSDSYNAAKSSAGQYKDVLTGIQQQQQLVAGRVSDLAKEYGGQTAALALLNEAGITSAQITDKNSQHWAQALIEVKAQAAALNEMALGAGRTAAGMNALGNSFLTGPLPAMQKMTQAEDQLLSVITGGRTALDTFEQGIGTLAQNFNQASGSTATVNEKLGKLKATASLAGATLGGTTQASYALNQAFYAEVSNGQKLIDSLQQQNASTAQLKTVVGTTAGQMLSFAGNNAEARAVIVDLINNALGPGTVSLQTLNKWVGSNSTSLAGMNTIMAQVTGSSSQLAGVLQQNLNGMLAQAAANALGGQSALDKFAQAVENGDGVAAAFANDGGKQVISMFERMYQGDIPKAENAFISWAENGLGLTITQAKNLWNGLADLQGKVDSLHGKNINVGLTTSGAGQIIITGTGLATRTINTTTGQVNAIGGHTAKGGYINVGTTPTADDVLVMASKGELVVPANMVKSGAVDHLRGKIPGFAAGGVVGAVDSAESQVGSAEAAFGQAAVTAFAQAALTAAQAAAAAAAGTPVAYSKVAGVTQWEPDVSRVLSMLGLPQADLPTVMAQILTESGGNPNAINLTDVNAQRGDPSKGLMQVISETFAAYRNPALSANIYDPLANIYAGVNYAVHRYGNPGWLSVLGHGHGYANGTSSAAPGWAWVGERGPELMRFRGGEQVIPSSRAVGGDIHVHLHNEGVIGSQAELDRWLNNGIDRLAREGRLTYALRRSPSAG